MAALALTEDRPSIGRGGRRPGAGAKPKPKDPEVIDAYGSFVKERAKKMRHDAKIAEYEERKMAASLLDAREVRQQGIRAAMEIRDGMLSIPPRVAEQLATMDDAREIEALLNAEIRAELTRLAQNLTGNATG